MSASYAIEPELLTPPPRRIVARKEPTLSLEIRLVLILVFLLPICLGGLALNRYILFKYRIQNFGEQTTGQITQIEEPGSDEAGKVYYTFRVGKEKYESLDAGSAHDFNLKLGGPITVNYFPENPELSELPLLSRSLPFAALVGITLGVNGLICMILYLCFIEPRIERGLYRCGEVAEGKVTAKTEKISPADNDGPAQSHYTVEYAFTPDPLTSSEPVLNSASVTAEEYKTVDIGDSLTILYSPRKPKRNRSYRLGGYKVV